MGAMAAKVDNSGRLKLPAKVQEYLGELPEKKLFITLNEGMAKLYTNGSWDRNLKILQACTTDPDAADRVALIADYYGADAEMDSNGRVTLPQELRRKLGLEDQSVQLRFFEDVIKVYKQSDFMTALAEAERSEKVDLEAVKRQGFK
jgi:MraZ protein